MEQVQDAYVSDGEPKYSKRLKAEVADYLSNILTYLMKVEELDTEKSNKRQRNFEEQLKPKNREAFSYAAQIVDSLMELAIHTGTIYKNTVSPWKTLKKLYRQSEGDNKNKDDAIIKDSYTQLVLMKNEIRDRYDYFHRLSSHEINKT